MLKIFRAALQHSPYVLGATLILANSALAIEAQTLSTDADQLASSLETVDQSALPISDRTLVSPASQTSEAKQEAIADTTLTAQLVTDETLPSGEPSVNSIDSLESTEEAGPMDQLNSITQLSDVYPTDWAYEALRGLVEKYQCIAGYPDGTYRGNRAMTRYEFAAGLNSCMESILRLAGGIDTSKLATKEDLAILQRLIDEFAVELATLRGRVDVLEARTAELEANQFSTTTKLKGEVIFAGSDIIGDGGTSVPHFTHRTRLNLNTSFSGKDLLLARLQAGNTANLSSFGDTPMDRLSFDANTNNNFELHKLYYRFPLTSKATVTVDANAAEYNDNVYVFNPLFESSGQGSISRFGRFNPIYRQGGGQGVTLNYNFSKAFNISLGYQAPNGFDSTPVDSGGGGGFFSGSYAALGQVTFRPSDRFALGFTYVNSYHSNGRNLAGGTGSANADNPFGGAPTSANHYGLQANLALSPRFNLAGWVGYTNAESEASNEDAKIWNWAVTLGFPDLGKEGNLLGFVVGMPPKVTDNNNNAREDNSGTSYHLEAFYRYQVTDNISITPGLFVLLNPNHNDNATTDYVGTIRTTFTF